MIIGVLSRLIRGVVLSWWTLLLIMISFTQSYWFLMHIYQLSHPSIISLIVFVAIPLRALWERWMQGVLKSSHWWNCGEATLLPLLWLVSIKQRHLCAQGINNILALTINKMMWYVMWKERRASLAKGGLKPGSIASQVSLPATAYTTETIKSCTSFLTL